MANKKRKRPNGTSNQNNQNNKSKNNKKNNNKQTNNKNEMNEISIRNNHFTGSCQCASVI